MEMKSLIATVFACAFISVGTLGFCHDMGTGGTRQDALSCEEPWSSTWPLGPVPGERSVAVSIKPEQAAPATSGSVTKPQNQSNASEGEKTVTAPEEDKTSEFSETIAGSCSVPADYCGSTPSSGTSSNCFAWPFLVVRPNFGALAPYAPPPYIWAPPPPYAPPVAECPPPPPVAASSPGVTHSGSGSVTTNPDGSKTWTQSSSTTGPNGNATAHNGGGTVTTNPDGTKSVNRSASVTGRNGNTATRGARSGYYNASGQSTKASSRNMQNGSYYSRASYQARTASLGSHGGGMYRPMGYGHGGGRHR